jgi:hypothetical protein
MDKQRQTFARDQDRAWRDAMSTFAEPRAWALQWEGSALRIDAPPPGTGHGWQGAATFGWKRLTLPEIAAEIGLNGYGKLEAASPRGWAVEWDGVALVGIEGVREEGKA